MSSGLSTYWVHYNYTKRKKLYAKRHEDAPSTVSGTSGVGVYIDLERGGDWRCHV